jgi:hypothetical protein
VVFNDLATFIDRLGIDWQSWKAFIEETIPSVAILAFGFSLLLYLSVTFLAWRRGAPWPRAQLFEYVFLGSFGSIYIAACFAALAALLWPAMQVLGFPNQVQASIASFLKFNYITVSGVAVVLLLIVVLLIWDNKASQPRLGRIVANALDMWWVDAWYETEKQNQFWRIVTDPDTTREKIEQMERDAADKGEALLPWLARKALRERFGGWDAAPQTEGSNLQPASTEPDPSPPRSRVSEGFHRLGIVVGAVLGLGPAALVVLHGEIVRGIGIGVVLFLVAYGFFRLLGWIVDGFFSGTR